MEEDKIVETEFTEPEKEDQEEDTPKKGALQTVEQKDKPGVFRRIGRTLATPFVWVGKQVKASPAGTAIGMVSGAAIALGAKALIGTFAKSDTKDYIPADLPEIELDDDGNIVDMDSSYATDTTSD